MVERKKRKAEDQLSPYTRDTEEIVKIPETEQKKEAICMKKAKIRRGEEITNKEPLKNIFSGISFGMEKNQEEENSDRKLTVSQKKKQKKAMRVLNKTFIKSLEDVLKMDPNADLSSIFNQYLAYSRGLLDKKDKPNSNYISKM